MVKIPKPRPVVLLINLLVIYAYLFIDRQIISLLVEPLKADLRISDTDIGVLQGLPFAVALGLGGLIAGRTADLYRRMTVIVVGLVTCGVMTLASGLTTSYAGLLLCRFGVGLGQAAFLPAAHSLIADSFGPRRLGIALGLFGVGSYLGAGIAYVAGGLAVERSQSIAQLIGLDAFQSWQLAFLLVGAIGLALALWCAGLDEAPRREGRAAVDKVPSAVIVLTYFRQNIVAFASLKLTVAFAAMASYAILAWYPSHLIRDFGWSTAATGAVLGPLLATSGGLGVILGGWLADVAARRHVGGRLAAMGLCAALAVVPACAAPLAPLGPGLVLLAIAVFLTAATMGINPSATMAMMPGRMRGVASAFGVLVVNIIGLGIGPWSVAIVSDVLIGPPGQLYLALAISLPAMLAVSMLCAICGIRAYARSIDRLETRSPMRRRGP
jgi:MFS family permease